MQAEIDAGWVRIDPRQEWLTIAEVARYYRVSPRTISRWAASGEIRSKRIGPSGRCVRIHRSAIEADHDLSVSAA